MKFKYVHNNINVLDLETSVAFYEKALGMTVARVKEASDGSFKLTFMTDVEGIHEILRELNERVFGREDCMTMGEGAGITWKNALNYIAPERKELDSVYHFELSSRKRPRVTAAQFREVQKNWAEVAKKGGWSIQYMSNHDSRRQVSHHGSDGIYRTRSAKLLGTLLHTSPGIPFIYQGEEIGMVDVRFESIQDYDCCYTVGPYQALLDNGYTPEQALAEVALTSRDNARTPYQWDDSENAGFTKGKPWLKLNPRYPEINLKKDLASPDSIFRYYQKLIRLRKEHPAMVEGDLNFYLEDDPYILCYTRSCEKETLLVVANYSEENAPFTVPAALCGKKAELLLSNCDEGAKTLADTTLLPWEVAVYKLG